MVISKCWLIHQNNVSSLATAVDSILRTASPFNSPHVYHNKALLCLTSLAGILSVINHFSSISPQMVPTFVTVKNMENRQSSSKEYTIYLMCNCVLLRVTCLPNSPDYN